jgi:uncharacterized protein
MPSAGWNNVYDGRRPDPITSGRVTWSTATLRVKSLALFGSVASGEGKDTSDLDFLVEFESPATFGGYMELKELLEKEFSLDTDMVTTRALKPNLREQVLREAIRLA